MALADGPRLRRWLPVEGELALRHRVSEREPLQTKLLGAPLLDWLGQAHTLEGLQDELRQLGLPAVLLLHVCLGAALESASDQRLFVRHSKRQGWAREWLDQELDIRPDDEGKAAVAEIAQRARRVKRVRMPAAKADSKAS